MITRRNFFSGLVAAPAVILTPGLLMPLHRLVMKDYINNLQKVIECFLGEEANIGKIPSFYK